MQLEDFLQKEYFVPENTPSNKVCGFVEVINKGWGKYLDFIYMCGGAIMHKQFCKILMAFNDTNSSENSVRVLASRMLKRLEELGFVKSMYVNRQKAILLRYSALSFVCGTYNHSKRINYKADLKNDRFIISLLTSEYALKYGEIVHFNNMFNQLLQITNMIKKKITETDNSYGYSLDLIDEILASNDFTYVLDLINEKPEYKDKLGILRGLWGDLGKEYRKMIKQRQSVSSKPYLLNIYSDLNGEIFLHYVPRIFIFDINNGVDFYKRTVLRLFNSFYGIKGNYLRNLQNEYLKSDRQRFGYEGYNHIGYVVSLIAYEKGSLKDKADVFNKEIGGSINSPMVDYVSIENVDISDYISGGNIDNEYSKKYDDKIDSLLDDKLSILSVNKNKNSVGKEFFDLIRN